MERSDGCSVMDLGVRLGSNDAKSFSERDRRGERSEIKEKLRSGFEGLK